MGEERSGEMLRRCAVGRGIAGALPKLEPGLEPGLELRMVDAAGLKYRSGDILDALYDGLRSVWGLFLNVTVCFSAGA